MNAGRVAAVAMLAPVFALAVSAASFPPLPASVSVEAARVNPALVSRLSALQTDRAAMIASIADFEKECVDVIAGSAADVRCAAYEKILTAAKEKHVERSRIFLADNEAAEAAAKVIAPPIVPKGVLSKAVDDAIAGAFRDAGPEVLDRVRRGYQSVAAGDWHLAKAWFKDALNRAPKNAGLKALVDVTEAPAPPTTHLQLPSAGDVLFLSPGVPPAATPVPHVPGPDDVYYYRPEKGYFRMTRNGARTQQLLDAMSGAKPGSIIEDIK